MNMLITAPLNVITQEKAKAEGYRRLTNGYIPPKEQAMLDNVLRDMRRGNIAHVLVEASDGVAVWRNGASNKKLTPTT